MERYNIKFNDNTKKYLQIYNHIKDMILNKELKDHEKLQPIRKLSEFIKVNNTTVVKAYELLENEGYIYKIVGSGTFVSSRDNNENIKFKKDGIIHFDNGNPSTDIFPLEDFKRAINIALNKEDSSMFEYEDGLGFEKLREKMVEYLKYSYIHTNKENIQIISGAQQGIDIVCKGLINYSDVVFIEEPTYNGAIQVFKSRGAKVVSIPMLDDGIAIGILKLKLEKIKPKLMYIMPNFQNPTGISYSTYKKQKLIELAQAYDFYILEDDFISDFKFESKDNRPIRSYDDKNRVIYIKSFSKIFMPGLRIGIVEIPNELLDIILWAKHASDISMYYYLENFSLETYLKGVEKMYTKKYLFAKELISDKLCKKLKMKPLDGGMNFFLELPRGYSSNEFARYMLKKGVAILPGTYFFDNLIEDRFFRINIANPSIQDLEKGISIISDNIDDFLETYKDKLNNKSNKLFY